MHSAIRNVTLNALQFTPEFVTSKSGRSNAGLGLAEVKKIIAKQNGAIHIESTVNTGTTLSIYLPQYIPSGQTQKDLV